MRKHLANVGTTPSFLLPMLVPCELEEGENL
jgi:hypothetical protein